MGRGWLGFNCGEGGGEGKNEVGGREVGRWGREVGRGGREGVSLGGKWWT